MCTRQSTTAPDASSLEIGSGRASQALARADGWIGGALVNSNAIEAELKLFVECLHHTEMSEDAGSRLRISVTYADSEEPFDQWVPTTASSITTSGIADPGFGSGPVSYAEVRRILVHATPKSGTVSEEYARKFDLLCKLTEQMRLVRTESEGISFTGSV